MRTTINLPAPLLRKIRDISHRRHHTLTRTLRDILTRNLETDEKQPKAPSPFRNWPIMKGDVLVDYTDKETLSRLFDKYP